MITTPLAGSAARHHPSPTRAATIVACALALILAALSTALPAHAAVNLKLPWATARWNITQGLHSTQAWDFQPPGAGSHNDEVLAVAAGTARLTCTDGAGQAIVSLATDAGTFRYVHLQTSAVQSAGITTGGVSVAQGQVLGRLHPSPPGSDPGCGYAIPAGASHLHLQMPTLPITVDGVTFSTSGPTGGAVTSTNTRQTSGAITEGQFVSHAGHVYRIAGGAPIYVSTWNVFGGGKPTTDLSDAQFNALRAYPADGTFVSGASSGKVYRFAGGAPEYVSTWSSFGGAQPVTTVDDFALDHPDGASPLNHVRSYPADGTFINNVADGRVYRVAGGAPLYVSSWANIGGAQPVTSLDPFEFSAYQHLRPTPADMFLRGLPSGRVFRVVWTGHPYYVESWAPYGGTQPFLDVDDWAIDNCDHLNCDPFGALDSASASGGKVTVKGWAIDPNARTSPSTIHVYVGGPAGDKNAQGFDIGTETGTRADIVASFPGVGSQHGFSKTVTTTKRGIQPVYVYAINANGTRGNNAEIGHSTVAITDSLSATPIPTISGTAAVGRTLTATPHAWKPAPVSLTYQWRRNTKAIPGATSKTYTLSPADKGAAINVTVTGSKTGYSPVSKTSKATGKVKAGTLHTATPTITGKPVIGTALTANPGKWSPAGIAYTYKWYRNTSTIKGATSQTYTVQAVDKGKRLRVKVYGHLAGYTTAARISAKTAKAHG